MKSSKKKLGDKKKTKFDDDYMFTSSEDEDSAMSVSSYKGTSGEIFKGKEKEIKNES